MLLNALNSMPKAYQDLLHAALCNEFMEGHIEKIINGTMRKIANLQMSKPDDDLIREYKVLRIELQFWQEFQVYIRDNKTRPEE